MPPLSITRIKNELCGMIKVMHVEGPPTKFKIGSFKGTQCIPKHLPEGDFLPRPIGRHWYSAKEGKTLLELCRLLINSRIHIADPHCNRMFPLEDPTVSILSVPYEGIGQIGKWVEGLTEPPSCNSDSEFDLLEILRNSIPSKLDLEDVVLFVPRHAVASVIEAEGRACEWDRFSKDLVLALDNGYAFDCELVFFFLLLGLLLFRFFRIWRRAVGPVRVPWGEVGDRHPPQGLAGLVEGSELLPLRVGNAEGCQGCRIVGHVVAVGVQLRHTGGDAQNFDNSAIF